MLGKSLLHFRHALDLGFLRRRFTRPRASRRVPRDSLAFGLGLLELRRHALVVTLDDILWHALHAENLDI